MKKLIACFTLLFAIYLVQPTTTLAQYGGSGSIDINAGIGIGSTLAGDGMPFSLSADYGYNEEISIGGYFGYASTDLGFWKYTHTIIGARSIYHKQFLDMENLHTYGGVMLGWNIASAEWTGTGTISAEVGGFTYTAFVGARYLFTSNLGAYAELGYGVALLSLGVSYRL